MYNPNDRINAAIRQQGMRRRWPAPQMQPQIVPTYGAYPSPVNMDMRGTGQQPTMDRVVRPAFSFQPPGVRAKLDEYNYEKMPDNTWKVYPPGQPAPPTGWQASMPAPASVMDLERIQAEQQKVEMMMKQRQTLSDPEAMRRREMSVKTEPNNLQGLSASYSSQTPDEKPQSAQPYREMMR